MPSVLWGKPSYLPGSIKIMGGTDRECRREIKRRQREGVWHGLRVRLGGEGHGLFTRLDDSDGRFKQMAVAYHKSVLKTTKPCGHVLGWEVFTVDGHCYLFRTDTTTCLMAEWFEFCHACRFFGLTAYWKGT